MNFARYATLSATQRLTSFVCTFVLLFGTLGAATQARAQQSENEKAVWKLETTYWEDVKTLNLDHYKTLWHENVIGWPYVNSQPARIDHIADWITRYTDKGLQLQWFSINQAASQSTGDLVVTHFWVTARWVDKDGHGEPSTSRITHTWIKTDKGWQIIGGMSSPIPAN